MSKKNKEYQFTVRVTDKMKHVMIKRLEKMGFNTLVEYIRHLIMNDIQGLEDYYGQTK